MQESKPNILDEPAPKPDIPVKPPTILGNYARVEAPNIDIDDAIGVSFSHKTKQFVTRCRLALIIDGSERGHLDEGYRWNGADIPLIYWLILVISPYDRRCLIASGFHDDGTEKPFVPQVLADAHFVILLRPFYFNDLLVGGVGPIRAVAMYMGVRLYSVWRFGKRISASLLRGALRRIRRRSAGDNT